MINVQIEKKKIIGLAVFAFILWLVIDPRISEKALEIRVRSLVSKGEYNTAYSLLENREIDPSSRNYLLMMHCEFMLEAEEQFNEKLKRLIANENREFIQELVDTYGEKLGSSLVQIYNLGGVRLTEAQRAIVAIEYVNRHNYDKAMEVRGEKNTYDFVALKYDLKQWNIQEALDGYYDIPKELQPLYIDTVLDTLLSHKHLESIVYSIGDWYEEVEVTDIDGQMEFIKGLDFPEEVFRRYISRLTHAKEWFYYYEDNEQLDKFFKNPLFTNHKYYDYYVSLAKLWRPYAHESSKLDLITNPGYLDLDTRNTLVNALENYQAISSTFHLSKGGVLMYTGEGGQYTKRFDTKTKTFLEDIEGEYTVLGVSPDRNYFIVFSAPSHNTLIVLDSNFEVVKQLDGVDLWNPSSVYWIDNSTLAYRSTNGMRAHDINTGEENINVPTVREPLLVSRYNQNTNIWSLGEQAYSSIERKYDSKNYLEQSVYTVKDLTTSKVLQEIEVGNNFVGSCERYIYEIEVIEYGFGILVATDKETKERIELPLYLNRGFGQKW